MTVYHLFQKTGLIALLLVCLFAPQKALANNGQGEIGAVLFDPLLVGLPEAIRFCEEEPQAVKCDILQERLDEKKEQEEMQALDTNYTVFSANFQ